jgi:hypothetical protein
MSSTAAAAGKGVVSGMMRQRAVGGGPLTNQPPDASPLPTAYNRSNALAHFEQSQLADVDMSMGGLQGVGKQFHTPTGTQLKTCFAKKRASSNITSLLMNDVM